MSKKVRLVFAVALCAASALAAISASEIIFRPHSGQRHPNPRTSQDSEFVFARIRYTMRPGYMGQGGFHGRQAWAHTFPQAEQHLLQIASEVTGVRLNRNSHIIIPLDSDDIFKYPFAYITEPGEMNLTEREAANLREYLARGGFVMVDDFNTQPTIERFTQTMRSVLPDATLAALKPQHSVFHAFYDTDSKRIESPYHHAGGGAPKFYGYYDPSGRLCMIVNHDNNLGAFWVRADDPKQPLYHSAQGVRLGINYMLYSLTH